MKKFFADSKYAISWGILGAVVVSGFLTLFLITKIVSEAQLIGDGSQIYNSINVTGEGEVIAIPDIATLSFSINESSEGSESAQKIAQEKLDAVKKYLTDQKVNSEDIKTTSFNIYPKYEWINEPCNKYGCQGQNNLVGYTVDHNMTVKIRDTAKAGEIVTGLTTKGVNNISGLQFTTDDETVLKDEARSKAIEDAKARAGIIAEKLGVKLGDVIGYYENNGNPYPVEAVSYGMGGGDIRMEKAVDLPVGQNTYKATVDVTFKIN